MRIAFNESFLAGVHYIIFVREGLFARLLCWWCLVVVCVVALPKYRRVAVA